MTLFESKLCKEINCRHRKKKTKNLQVENQKESSLIVNIGGILSELPQGPRQHAAEERQPGWHTSWSKKNTRGFRSWREKNPRTKD